MSASNRLPILAAKIKRAHSEARSAASTCLERAIAAGKLLLEAKATVPHGQWLAWLQDNCDMPERTAQHYLRLAKHEEVIDTKSATVADLTVRGAVAEITEPKWPASLSAQVAVIRPLPPSGHIRIGLRECAAGWDEVWVAPSFQHPIFFYVSHVWTPRIGGASMIGTRKPIRADMVATLVAAHFSCDMQGINWTDHQASAWTHNILLYPDSSEYIDHLAAGGNIDELVEIAVGKKPSNDMPHSKRSMVCSDTPQPLATLIFDEIAT